MLNTISNFITSNPIGQIFGLGRKTVEWKKVNELRPGMKIAVASPSDGSDRVVEWDEIVSIKSVGQEQVYDIEVEGTHNFIGNDIVAHNTYISGNLEATGNVGIGVTGTGVTNLLTVNQAASTTAATVGTYGIDLQDQGSHRLTIGGDANYAYIQTWNSKPLQINNQGNNVLFNSGGGSVGIGTTGPDAKLDSLATTEQLRLSYTDGSVYSSHTVNSSGDLTIDNTGTQTIIADDLAVNGATSADITTTTTTATVFDTTATTLSLGGAATTALNLGNGSGNYTAINLGSGAGTHVINIAGTGATAADTINIGTGGTGADTINLGSNASTTALNFTSGTGAQTFASSMATGNAFVFNANSLSTGLGLYLSSTSTALSSGSLASLDWSPGSATTATGDLLKLNIGANGLIGNIFNVLDNGSSVFSVSQTAVTAGLPASFTSAGDVSLAYDLLFTNQTSSNLKSNGPLYLTAGESWESNDLTLQTYNSGNIILNSANLWADGSNVGIGTTSPTALLHLGIGSTAMIGQKITLASGATANAFEVNSSTGVGGDKFLIKANGNVGIGTTAPADKLNIVGGGIKFDTTGSTMDLVSGSSDTNTFIIKLPEKNSAACGSGNAEGTIFKNTAGTQVGHICISTLAKMRYFAEAFNATSTDLAENYSDATDSLQPGDIVTIDETTPKGVKKTSGSNTNKLIGIVSTNPGLVLSDISEDGGKTTLIHPKPIALSGRVPTKVSTENGPISSGDFLAPSSIPGVAMKATKAGEVIGKALENYSNSNSQEVGSILTFVNVSWYDPDVYFTATGDLKIVNSQISNSNFQTNSNIQNNLDLGTWSLELLGETINRVGTFSEAFIANLTAGIINADKLVSPVAEIDTLRVKDNLLSPLATIDTLYADKSQITNLKSQTATVSGTLYASEINSPTIDSLNDKYASASAILASIRAKYADYASLNNPNAANDPLSTTNLSSQNATISGEMALYNQPVIITDTLMVNTSLISNSINSNDTALYIQPTANQPLNLMAGLMTLTPDGKVVVNGDLTVTGTLYADKSQITNLKSQTATISGSLTVNQAIISDLIIAAPAIASASGGTASSSATLASNATIGTGIIASGSAEVKIENSKIENSTYIYLTPISDTANQVLYVKTKQEGVGFTVSITDPVARDIKFNYWLIQTK